MSSAQVIDIEEATLESNGMCQRRGSLKLSRVGASDGSGAWSIYKCERCCFSWRSTEDVWNILSLGEDRYSFDESKLRMPVRLAERYSGGSVSGVCES